MNVLFYIYRVIKKFVDRCNRINFMKFVYKIYKEYKIIKMLEILICYIDNFLD